MPIPFGRYTLLKKLAAGGMGQVLLARKGEGDFEKLVVIKRILPHLVEDEEFFTMFRDEARITMRLDHPNIARINEFGTEGGVHFIELEYVAGADLRRIEKQAAATDTGIPIGVVLRVIADAAAGLDFAHKARDTRGAALNVVHRDVSPQNILVGFDGSVKLIDFGVAKAAGRSQHTATGILKGKFPYMSPEQADGLELDARSDVFALGIVLWEQLTGRRLFKGDNDLATQRLVRACEVPVPSQVESSVPAGLDPITLKALARKPSDRYPDAAALRMALENFALANGIASSSAHLSAFMHELYAERIAKESSPTFYEEDTGLTDLDAGGLPRRADQPTSIDRGKALASAPVTQAITSPAPKRRGGALVGALVALALVGCAGWWWSTRQAGVTPAVPPPPVQPAVIEPTPPPPPEPEPPDAGAPEVPDAGTPEVKKPPRPVINIKTTR